VGERERGREREGEREREREKQARLRSPFHLLHSEMKWPSQVCGGVGWKGGGQWSVEASHFSLATILALPSPHPEIPRMKTFLKK